MSYPANESQFIRGNISSIVNRQNCFAQNRLSLVTVSPPLGPCICGGELLCLPNGISPVLGFLRPFLSFFGLFADDWHGGLAKIDGCG